MCIFEKALIVFLCSVSLNVLAQRAIAVANHGTLDAICNDILAGSSVVRNAPQHYLYPRELGTLANRLGTVYRDDIMKALERARTEDSGIVRSKVFENAYFNVWATKLDGQATPIQNYGGSRVGIYVLDGSVVDDQYLPPDSVPRRFVIPTAGEISYGAPHVHHLYSRDGAILQVFSPPMTEKTVFQLGAGGSLVPAARLVDGTP